MAVGEDMWIQYEFETPQTFKAFSIVGASHTALEDFNGGPLNRALKVSDDGVTFKEVATVSGSIVSQNTVSFHLQPRNISDLHLRPYHPR